MPAAPPAISGGFNSFNERTSGYKGRVYITRLWPTAAGTTPLLSPVIWLSPSLLATEGKGYYSFVAFESKVLSELPSLSSSSQITLWGIFMTTSQFSPEKAERRKQMTHHRIHSNGEAQQSQILTIPLLPLCLVPPTFPVNPPETPSWNPLPNHTPEEFKLAQAQRGGNIKLTIHYILCHAFFFFKYGSLSPPWCEQLLDRGGVHLGASACVVDEPEAMAQCACVHVCVRSCLCVCVCERDRGREIECQCVISPLFLTAEPERHSLLRAITTNDLCGQSRGPARVLISSPEKGTLLECYQGAWD